MQFKRLSFKEGTGVASKLVETYNFHKAAAVLAEYGFDCMRLSDDWAGADFFAYHKENGETLKVQLKSNLVIAEKYMCEKDLFMCFPLDSTGNWYLIKHSDLMELVRQHSPYWLQTTSWQDKKMYGSNRGTKEMREALEPYAYWPQYGVINFREVRDYRKAKKLVVQQHQDDPDQTQA